MSPAPRRIAVVGVGNPERGDDAAGRIVARRVRAELAPRIAVLERSGNAADLVQVLTEYDTVIIIDAVQTGAAQRGHVHRIDAHAEPLPATFRAVSTHGFGVGEGIELARALGKLPPTTIVYGIEAGGFDPGQPPSPAVSVGIENAVGAVTEYLSST